MAEITFDPGVTSMREILEVFFAIHDPTTKGRQGNDASTQYRSVIFYHSEEQRAACEELIRELDAAGIWNSPIVTEVQPASKFFRAEDYHQGYFTQPPGAALLHVRGGSESGEVRRGIRRPVEAGKLSGAARWPAPMPCPS